jgi:hypothetical protein
MVNVPAAAGTIHTELIVTGAVVLNLNGQFTDALTVEAPQLIAVVDNPTFEVLPPFVAAT